MKRTAVILASSVVLALALSPLLVGQMQQNAMLRQARHYRDLADANALSEVIAKGQAQASQNKTYESYLQLALLQNWMCEVAYDHQDTAAVKAAAEAGVRAANMAIQLSPNSSDAHWLLGSLMAQLIPLVPGGGMRYGMKATSEVEKAIALDPKNANAYVSRGTDYYFTPAMFGGSKTKAVAMLEKAIALDPASDAAAAAHIWLAQIYQQQGKHPDAMREISAARKLGTDRRWTQYVYQTIESGKQTAAGTQ
jgi:tetratricopeptide (TPR) repeat protein